MKSGLLGKETEQRPGYAYSHGGRLRGGAQRNEIEGARRTYEIGSPYTRSQHSFVRACCQ